VLLLHANEVVSSYRLIDDLWGGAAPASAPKILQSSVSRLRRALDPDRIETRGHGYRLRVEPDELDAARFERLVADGKGGEALALWRGLPLVDLEGRWFANIAARRLEEVRLTALEQRIEDDLATGGNAALVAELEQLVAHQPFRERFQAQLMRALYASGRQAEALEAFRGIRSRLSDELGLEPGPELQELEGAILRHDPALRSRSGRP
jgi:DNA-binding SARP family transcriptional activator